MRSKAQIKSHPIHPMLVGFPIAFLFGALLFDVMGWLGDQPSLQLTGAYLSIAAVISGLAAGVPGLIDYLYVVPPRSSGKARATWHMAVNLSALAAFVVAWAFRDRLTWSPGLGTLLLEAAGVALVTWGGWMGGTLVYRNQIGVDHRYAGAGKWREESVDGQPGEKVAVARSDELSVDQMKLLHLGDRRIVLARTERGYTAFDDHCTHKGGPLSDGVMICGTVSCPWHGSQFNAQTGEVAAGPAKTPISTYPVEELGGEVRLTVPSSPSRPA